MDPVHFAMVGIINWPSVGDIMAVPDDRLAGMRMADALKDTMIMLLPMLGCWSWCGRMWCCCCRDRLAGIPRLTVAVRCRASLDLHRAALPPDGSTGTRASPAGGPGAEPELLQWTACR